MEEKSKLGQQVLRTLTFFLGLLGVRYLLDSALLFHYCNSHDFGVSSNNHLIEVIWSILGAFLSALLSNFIISSKYFKRKTAELNKR